ncbi:oxidoreductase C-terminal domain-containing protein [Streptomyces canus]|uniref:oxidoreductase C-terminal domain-containing protein n=1 Tax=Streptomyces canus TaxID=58343 RepID=UPI003252DEC4
MGEPARADRSVRRGSPSVDGFALFRLGVRRMVAVEVNAGAEFTAGGRPIAERAETDPERLSNLGVSLREPARRR